MCEEKEKSDNKVLFFNEMKKYILPPKFKIEPLSLVMVNILIFVYLWKILPALFQGDTFNKVFAVTVPIIFLFAGAFYAWRLKKILFWQLILTILISMKYLIIYGYSKMGLIDLVTILMFYYLMLHYGGYLTLHYLRKTEKYNEKVLYRSPQYRYKIFKYINVLIILYVVNTSVSVTVILLGLYDKILINIFLFCLSGSIIYKMMKCISFSMIFIYLFFNILLKNYFQEEKNFLDYLLNMTGGFIGIFLSTLLTKYFHKLLKYSIKEF